MLRWAWEASKHADPALPMRLKFVAAAHRERAISNALATADPTSPLGQLLIEWPGAVGFLLWPHQCASWDARARFSRITEHLEAVRAIAGLDLAPDEKLVLVDLSAFSPGASLVLDRAPWLAREGLLTLSLFKDHFRAFTISFSLSGYPETELFIGGLQGRNSEQALSLYRDLTKDFEGMRPRDFIVETLRLFALNIGARHIYAVAEQHKISRHKYFAGKDTAGLNYSEVWLDRGGTRVGPTHFELPLMGSRRPLDQVSTKKRSMYRRRYEMLDAIEVALPADLTAAERRRFDAQ